MESFVMEIAGAVAGIQPLFLSTREYCRPYLTEKLPEFWIGVTREDLLHEQMLLNREAVEEGLKLRKFEDPFLERSVIQRRVADALLTRDTILLHGSTVAVDGSAYLFTAPCGTGKSTHTGLWRAVFGDRAVMVNDDKPFLRLTPDGVLACGSPWNGKRGLGSNLCVPLKGICSLHRGKENKIFPGEAGGLREILHRQVYIPEDAALAEKAIALTDKLAEAIPLWEMHCNTDPAAARMAYEAMAAAPQP